MIGLFLGSVLGGNLTDYFGRINTMKLCMGMISIFLLLPAMIIRQIPVEMFILKYSIIFVSRVIVQSFEVSVIHMLKSSKVARMTAIILCDIYILFSIAFSDKIF